MAVGNARLIYHTLLPQFVLVSINGERIIQICIRSKEIKSTSQIPDANRIFDRIAHGRTWWGL